MNLVSNSIKFLWYVPHKGKPLFGMMQIKSDWINWVIGLTN